MSGRRGAPQPGVLTRVADAGEVVFRQGDKGIDLSSSSRVRWRSRGAKAIER